MAGMTDPAHGAFAITKSDSTVIQARALYIGVTGDVAVVTEGRTASVTFKNVPVGVLPVQVTQVLSTGTTASEIIGFT